MIHKLPGTYMLRELQDVTVLPAISWQPQTAGWVLLAMILGSLALLWIYHRVQLWWQQRYRREALAALRTLNWSNTGTSLTLFHIIKEVLTHLSPGYAKLFGTPLLQTLDSAMPDRQTRFATELGERWLVSLVCDQVVLSVSDQLCLVSLCSDWLQHHQTPCPSAALTVEARHA
ncbi:MAG: DUF4381 domain-containing protein [Aeromonas sobria]|jgi:hypothetical protein|nr:DUF4381 domain-containing protein [Aeromonas sobria]HEH9418555.1 DUF4381 domain-containing protein [Aeromonas sobria]